MSAEYYTRLYEAGDEKNIQEVLKNVFSYWARHTNSDEYWKWRYRDTPVQKNVIALAFKGEKMVGCSHNNSLHVKLNNEVGLCYLVGACAILPDHRGKGIYNKLRDLHNKERVIEGSILSYWITENPILIASDKRRGDYPFPFKIKQYVRINDIDDYFKNRNVSNGHIKKMAYKTALILQKALKGKDHYNDEIEIIGTDHFPTEVDTFWDGIRDRYSFIIERNKKYLDWRYLDHRGGIYSVLIAYKREKLAGFIVTKTRQINEITECIIVDYLVSPQDGDTLSALFNAVCNLNAECVRVSSWAIEGSTLDETLPKLGFVYDRSDIYIGFHLTESSFQELVKSDPSKVHLTFSDIETL